ncbi:MAG: toll/interleukin-1 receptor domain-containing protein [Rhodothermales bacterium]
MTVFISYAHSDRSLATEAAQALKKQGLRVWLDAWEILPGDNWSAKRGDALRDADAMVLLLTNRGIHSHTIEQDLSFATSERRFKGRVYPIYDGQEAMSEGPWVLKRLQGIRLDEYPEREEAFHVVADQIKKATPSYS